MMRANTSQTEADTYAKAAELTGAGKLAQAHLVFQLLVGYGTTQ